MKTKFYDVIIVGAGVSGLMLAKLLNDSDLNVLLVEKRNTIKKLKNSRFGTFKEIVEEFGLENYVISKYKKFAFGLTKPEYETVFEFKENRFQVVDMNLFAKELILKHDVLTSFYFKNITYINNCVQIVDKKGDIYLANIIVDCSGDEQIVSKYLKRKQNKNPINFYNTSLELKNCNIPKEYVERIDFPQNFRYMNIPLWIYPYSENKCQFGHADLYSKKFPLVKNQGESIYLFIKNEEPYKTWFKDAEIISMVKKPAFTTIIRSLIDDNLICCGDAGGATTPQLGEGFRIALEMSRMAKKVILESFEKEDFSRSSLQFFEDWYFQTIGRYFVFSKIMRFILLRYITDYEFDVFSKNLKNLNNEEFIKFLKSEIDVFIFLKLFKINLIFRIFLNMFKYHIINFNKKLTIRITEENENI